MVHFQKSISRLRRDFMTDKSNPARNWLILKQTVKNIKYKSKESDR